jgi:hypothetical protein
MQSAQRVLLVLFAGPLQITPAQTIAPPLPTPAAPWTYKGGTKAPFIVVHDGPKLGEPDMTLARVLIAASSVIPARS